QSSADEHDQQSTVKYARKETPVPSKRTSDHQARTDSSSDLSDADEPVHDNSPDNIGDDEDNDSNHHELQNSEEEEDDAPSLRRRTQRHGSSSSEQPDSDEEKNEHPTQQAGPSGRSRVIRHDGDSDEEGKDTDEEATGEHEGEEDYDAGDHEVDEHQSEEGDGADQEPDETRIAVDFPLIRADLGKEMYLVKMPNFLSVETRPFDPNYYEDELDEDEVLDEEGRTRLKLKVENTIRWRYGRTPEGELVHESNARIVRWSDGSLSLHLGDEIFDIHKVDIQSDYNYLFIREGSGLQGQSSLRTKLTFRPHSTDSFTHRKITLSLADKTNKSQKVKILPVVGADPETNRNDLVRKEEEKLRAALRRENKLRRMRERQAMSRSSFGSDRRRSYGDDDDEDEDDDGNTTSLNALKRNAKASLNASRKEVAAVYSESESESLSDISEPKSRKKVRAKIIDEEDDSD
ncbi:RNA polymerase-associated protein LEO1, partial [Fasciola gigantica]